MHAFAIDFSRPDRNLEANGSSCDGGYNFCDATAKNNILYLYVVTATVDSAQSGPSNVISKSR